MEIFTKPNNNSADESTYFKLYNCETKMFDLCRITRSGSVEIVERGVDKLQYGKDD